MLSRIYGISFPKVSELEQFLKMQEEAKQRNHKKLGKEIHRVVFGSIERFMGILIEHYAGKFPLWLSPVQVKLLPIGERFTDLAEKVAGELAKSGLRYEIDYRSEKIGYKIREAQLDKVPYMILIGQKEADTGEVSVRSRDRGDEGSMPLSRFIQGLQEEMRR